MIKNKQTNKPSVKREKQTRYLSQAIQLEEAVNPHIIRATMTMVSFALLAFIVWAGFTNINEVARTPGEVVPHGHQQTVQHLEGGIVQHINVHEGEVVEAGQALISLYDGRVKKDLQRAQVKQLGLEMQAERLRAFIQAREPDFSGFDTASDTMIADQKSFFEGMRNAREKEQKIVRDQAQEKRQNMRSLESDLATAKVDLKIAQDMYGRRKKLNQKGYASDMKLLEDERQVNQITGDIRRLENQILIAKAQIREYEDRLDSLAARHRDEALERLSATAAEKAQKH